MTEARINAWLNLHKFDVKDASGKLPENAASDDDDTDEDDLELAGERMRLALSV
jgi:hypothetical protein